MRAYTICKIGIMIGVALASIFITLCGYVGLTESKKMADKRLISANCDFGLVLFAELLRKQPNKNIFISPTSISIALSMVYNGAGSETQQGMRKTLRLQGLDLEEVNRANAALRESLENPDPKVQLTIANSLWARKGIPFKPDFMERKRKYYAAEVAALNFDDPDAPSTINSWVRRKSGEKITRIVDQIARETVLFLINAIYFKGRWAVEFDKRQTQERAFTLSNGTQKMHPMMSQSGRYRYYRDKHFQAVSLPYGAGRMSLYVFLPEKNSSLEGFYRGLTMANWNAWMSQFHDMEGRITLPRFKLEYEAVLNDALKNLGMAVAFDGGRADFTGMVALPLKAYISQVKHKTFVEVNEEGTEAAAVTSGEMQVTSMPMTFTMVIDRPFFCAIRDNDTGTILFLGSIADPK